MSENHNQRTRTIHWEDPMIGASAAMQLSGIDYMRKLATGELPPPPIGITMNFSLGEIEEGRAVFIGEPDESVYNPIGSVHGGYAATLLDSALGCAVHTTLEQGYGYSTVELHVNLVRGISAQVKRLICEGKVIHRGRRMATAEARITDDDGKLYAHGTTTCLIFEIPTPG
jgi:uncharacterized protein (TIGR00369 family)